jgi:ferredoxin
MKMELHIQINREACIGSQNCVRAAPHIFDIDDDGLARVRDGALTGPAELLVAVVENCPVGAIETAMSS